MPTKKKKKPKRVAAPATNAATSAADPSAAAAAAEGDPTPIWFPNHRACTATWIALRMLDQSERPFPTSGTVRMDQLTFFNAVASDDMRRFQAGTLAKQLDNFFRQIDGAVFEAGKDAIAAVSDIRNTLLTADRTMAGLATVVDATYRFWDEG
jgi:hypothetical protein